VSKWETPLHVYLRKIGEAPEKQDTRAMRFGRAMEAVIVDEFARETGLGVARYPVATVRHESAPWVYATPDAILENGALLECKTTNDRAAKAIGDAGTDDVPTEWLLQVQQQMACTGADVAHIAALIGGRDLRLYVVERDDDLIDEILFNCDLLWNRHIAPRVPPEPDYSHEDSHALMRRLYARGGGDAINLPSRLSDLIAERQRLKVEYSERERAIKSIDAEIAHEMRDAERGETGDWVVSRVSVRAAEVPAYVRDPYHYFKFKSKEQQQ
jgi:putative phage-type endonuclease